MSLKDRIVLITGASSGIGEALAREYAQRGAKVALVARRTERIAALCRELNASTHDKRAIAVTADVTRDGDMSAAVARTIAELGGLDVVIANAGSGVNGHVTELELADYRAQVELNVFGVLRTVYASLEALEQSRGSIVIVSSVMAYLAMPASSAYSMSKAAARSLAESLRVDLAPLGVNVTHVAPGFINTELRRMGPDGKRAHDGADPVPPWLQMPAPVAARKIIRATARRRRELVLTGHGKIGVFFGMHFAGLTAWVMSLVSRLTHRAEQRKQKGLDAAA